LELIAFIKLHSICDQWPDFRKLAFLAMAEGLYSPQTERGDIEGILTRLWRKRGRYRP